MYLLQNWNYDEDTAKAVQTINIFKAGSESKSEDETTSSSNSVSLDCENCYSTLKSDLVFTYSLKYGLNPLPYLSVSFSSELSVRFNANLDFVIEASYQYKYKSKPISLAKFRPQSLRLGMIVVAGIPLTLTATFGMDVRYACE